MAWAVKILDKPHADNPNVVWTFPYWINSFPPYPGFEVLELWIETHYPGAKTERLWNNGNSTLQITFETTEDAFMFILSAQQPKTVK